MPDSSEKNTPLPQALAIGRLIAHAAVREKNLAVTGSFRKEPKMNVVILRTFRRRKECFKVKTKFEEESEMYPGEIEEVEFFKMFTSIFQTKVSKNMAIPTLTVCKKERELVAYRYMDCYMVPAFFSFGKLETDSFHFYEILNAAVLKFYPVGKKVKTIKFGDSCVVGPNVTYRMYTVMPTFFKRTVVTVCPETADVRLLPKKVTQKEETKKEEMKVEETAMDFAEAELSFESPHQLNLEEFSDVEDWNSLYRANFLEEAISNSKVDPQLVAQVMKSMNDAVELDVALNSLLVEEDTIQTYLENFSAEDVLLDVSN